MSEFKHGVYVSEVDTAPRGVLNVSASLPVVIGTAPVGMIADGIAKTINKPIVCRSLAEFREAFGFVGAEVLTINAEPTELSVYEFTLCDFAETYFTLYGGSTAVFINVLGSDPSHTEAVAPTATALVNGEGVLDESSMIASSVVVKNTAGDTTYVEGTDYVLSFNRLGRLVVAVVEGGAMESETSVMVEGNRLDVEAVTDADIIGGEDPVTLKATGLELIDKVLPTTQLVPGLVVSPRYSSDPLIAAVMDAKVRNINGNFRAMALVDIPSTPGAAPRYTDVAGYKLAQNINSRHQIACWPACIGTGGRFQQLSTHMACVIAATDSDNDGLPYVSPSNKRIQITALVDSLGEEVVLDQVRANVVNSAGAVTALFSATGWTSWGNRTAAFPIDTGAPDSFISVRRMFNFVGNTVVMNNRAYLDDPLNTKVVQAVLSMNNSWLSGLVGTGALVDGRVEFLEEDNPLVNLSQGEALFRIYLTPPSPLEVLQFQLRYDASALASLFN